jgi:Cation/multidrug efflux pump
MLVCLAVTTKNNVSTIDVKLVDKKERNVSIDVFAQKLKAEIMQVPGVRARVSVKGVSGDTTEPIQFIVQGTDFEKVQQTAALILNAVRHTPGTN